VFLGGTDDGGEADVPEELIDLAQQLFEPQQPVILHPGRWPAFRGRSPLADRKRPES
jgi:hypothetical protein